MKPSTATLMTLYLLSFFVQASAATYYLDFSNGDNSKDGLSEANAWKDLFKIRAIGPQPGDVFLFKRGEVWEGLQFYITASGTMAQPITYGAYGPPADPLPIITSLTDISDAAISTNWTPAFLPNTWAISIPDAPGRLFLDGIEYLRAHTLGDLATTDSEGAFGHWFYDDLVDRLYLYATQNPANLYTSIAGSALFFTTLIDGAEHIVIENLDLRAGSGASLGIVAGRHVEVRNCHLGHSANSGINLRSSQSHASTFNISVHDNTFDSDFTFFYGTGSERGCGDGINLFWGVDHCTVYNNTFKNWAHNAIELVGDTLPAAGVNDNQFYDNFIHAPDIPYSHPLGADGFQGKCQNNQFFRNYIENCRTASQINGNNNWVHHNIIIGIRDSPAENLEPTAYAFIVGVYGDNLVSNNNRFDHNLIIDTDEAAFLFRNFGFPEIVQNHQVRNNIFYQTGQAPFNNDYNVGTGIVIYNSNGGGVGGNTFQNNLFYNDLGDVDAVYTRYNTSYYSATQFNALNGANGYTILDNIAGDPLFTDLANGVYLPQGNSPAINSGMDTGLSLDYDQNPRFVGMAPDIGPYENQVTLPVHLSYFEGRVIEQNVLLNWKTSVEVNHAHFEIERKEQHQGWQVIANVQSEAAPGGSVYQYLDHPRKGKIFYYRLKQVDLDGQFVYSKVVSCEIEVDTNYRLVPVDKGMLRLTSTEYVAPSRMLLLDASGRLVEEVQGNDLLSIAHLPRGPYLLKAENKDGGWEVLPFIK